MVFLEIGRDQLYFWFMSSENEGQNYLLLQHWERLICFAAHRALKHYVTIDSLKT